MDQVWCMVGFGHCYIVLDESQILRITESQSCVGSRAVKQTGLTCWPDDVTDDLNRLVLLGSVSHVFGSFHELLFRFLFVSSVVVIVVLLVSATDWLGRLFLHQSNDWLGRSSQQ